MIERNPDAFAPFRVLNLFAGVGGNRHLWPSHWRVTAIEIDPRVAAVYQRHYPNDEVIVGDAHEYLRVHYSEFDLIWSSPPCPTHSVMVKATRHPNKKYPDMMLYQEIIFLQHIYKGKYVVENVKPYYSPLIDPSFIIGRHYFWSNLTPGSMEKIPHFASNGKSIIKTTNVAGKLAICEWLGIPPIHDKIYFKGNHDPTKIVRNCVHPEMGLHIVKEMI